MGLSEVRAAGGLVWRTFRGKRQVLLVHRPAYDDWTLPKGKLEADESEAEAALREVAEETSVRGRLGRDLGTISYLDGNAVPKTVRFWQMEVDGGRAAPANEVDEVQWVGFDEAAVRLSYLHERQVVRRFAPPPHDDERVTIRLVRHAKAGDRTLWTGPDPQRPLTKPGRRQAIGVADSLSRHDLARLLSSPYVRCTQTLQPAAAKLDLAVQTVDWLGEGANAEGAMNLLASEAAVSGPLAASTHGDIMMLGIEALLDRGVRLRGRKVDFKKGCIWELTLVGDVFTEARYRRPPSD